MVTIEKCSRQCTCKKCQKPIEAKDWRAKITVGSQEVFFHLKCRLDICDYYLRKWTSEAKEIKKHSSLLKKEREKFILRSI